MVRGVFAVLEHERSGLIDRDRARSGGRIGRLARVEGQRAKVLGWLAHEWPQDADFLRLRKWPGEQFRCPARQISPTLQCHENFNSQKRIPETNLRRFARRTPAAVLLLGQVRSARPQ